MSRMDEQSMYAPIKKNKSPLHLRKYVIAGEVTYISTTVF